MPIFVSAFLIGIIAGLRAMMAPTMICWAACCGWLNLEGTPLHFFSSATGALSGAAIGAARQSLVLGLIAGAVGAVAGTYGGAALRGWLSSTIGKPLPAALIEDAIAIFGGLLIVSHL